MTFATFAPPTAPVAAAEEQTSSAAARTRAPWKAGERVCSIEELSRAANVRLSRTMPISKYFHDLDETLAKAKARLLDQDLQYAYVFYLRYVTVVVKHLPGLPDYHRPEYAKQRERASRAAKKALSTLEKLQPILHMRYEEYIKYLNSLPRPVASVSTFSSRRGSSSRRLELPPSPTAEASNPLPAIRPDNKADSDEPVPAPRPDRRADSDKPLLPTSRPDHRADSDKPLPASRLDRMAEAAHHRFSLSHTLASLGIGSSSHRPASVPPPAPKEAILIEYPAVEPSPTLAAAVPAAPAAPAASPPHPAPQEPPPLKMPPPVPPRPKHAAGGSVSSVTSVTSELLDLRATESALSLSALAPLSPQPSVPPKPQGGYSDDDAVFMPACIIDAGHFSATEGGVRMRPVQLPAGIVEEFIDIAAPNTRANIETCGVLCGRQAAERDALVMTTLIIPKQSATSDTCTTEREEELFVEQIARDLITIGWIHTHPSQTCFMSSLDLHTQCSYQLMLPEAIAIVCAPKHDPRFGIFRLTDPAGIDVIQNCKQKAAFHPHDAALTIYTDADTGGHVVMADYDFDIIDLRGAPPLC
ncbi:hypothetical protein GGI02_005278 [Coemansia sp. RSA 2322]|nr:hypothetical protein GGI02_005278 [Coemansia sp. RSA 2322]